MISLEGLELPIEAEPTMISSGCHNMIRFINVSGRWLLPSSCVILLLILWSCATQQPSPPPLPPPEAPAGYPKPYKALGKWYQPLPDSKGFREFGRASWYGQAFHGRKTSSGERYDMYAMTAAHKTLPLGTRVSVRHLGNGRRIDVRINDRGPFVRGRVIDLSYAAAKKLGIVGPGTGEVEVVALATPIPADSRPGKVDLYSGNFTFQVGAFGVRENAERLKAKLSRTYPNAHITPFDRGDRILYRVRIGHAATLKEAAAVEAYLIRSGFPDAFAVAE
jgi:rare lipoprotein A